MNSKKVGIAFFLLMVIHYLVVIGTSVYYLKTPDAEEMGIVENLILAQLMIIVPALLTVLIGKGRSREERLLRDVFGFRRIKATTALMTVLYAFLLVPLATLFNAISMLFVENTVTELSGDILEVPFFIMFLLMAVIGPLSEETVFRGIFYRSYRKSGNIFGAVLLSAVLFALMHMNFNQAAYAVALGIMMALLAEAAGSTTASFLCHMIFNGQTVCLLYLEKNFFPEELMEQLENYTYTTQELVMMISVYLFLAVVCTAIAFCVLVWIAGNEGKRYFLQTVWASRKNKKQKLCSVWLILGIILALAYMLFEAFLLYLMPYLME